MYSWVFTMLIRASKERAESSDRQIEEHDLDRPCGSKKDALHPFLLDDFKETERYRLVGLQEWI